MIDHTGVVVSDIALSKTFYQQALASIGYQLLMEIPASVTGSSDVAGFGALCNGIAKPDFWISSGEPNRPAIHVAFAAENRAQVNAFFAAAIVNGGQSNGEPGLRPHYHPHYYSAFVHDPDGHNIELVCHSPE